jgi:hypothetical protein
VTTRQLVLPTLLAAVVAFCVVQDRVTAAGARRYVALQREMPSAAPKVRDVMAPAVHRSVLEGSAWGGAVLVVGLVCALMVARQTAARAADPTRLDG